MTPTNCGTILPGNGIEGILLGMDREDVKGVMGEPEEITSIDFGDGSDSTALEYSTLGLSFNFGSEGDYVLDTIRIERSDTSLFDRCLVGLTVVEALALFEANSEIPDSDAPPLDHENDDGNRVCAYDFDGLGLTVWFLNDALNIVQIGTLWESSGAPIYPWENKSMKDDILPSGSE